jgi:hypothetical protein
MIAVLDGCLVNGYGSQASLGWAKAFSGTNKASYLAPSGARMYLDVDDSAPDGTALGRNCRVRGYESMSGVGTGTNPFPTVAQSTQGVVPKSTTADGTSRPWLLIGDDKTFYFFGACTLTLPYSKLTGFWSTFFFFGDFQSTFVGDAYRSIIGYPSVTSTLIADASTCMNFPASIVSSNTVNTLQNTPRAYTQAGSSIWNSPFGNATMVSSGTPSNVPLANQGAGVTTFPNPSDGGLYVSAVRLVDRGNGTTPLGIDNAPNGFRGTMRGFYQQYETLTSVNDQDTFSGVGDFLGVTFVVVKFGSLSTGVAIATTAWAFST